MKGRKLQRITCDLRTVDILFQGNLMKRREVSVAFYEICISSTTKTKGITPSSARIEDLLAAVGVAIRTHGKPSFSGGSIVLEVMDWGIARAGVYKALLNKADTDHPDVIFRNSVTKSRRSAGKTVVDGVDISTHIIMKPVGDGRRAVALVTQGAGIGISAIEKVFRRLFKYAKECGVSPELFEFDHPSGVAGQKYNVQYGVNCYGHKSQTLDRDLAAGRFVDMELVTPVDSGFDSNGEFRVRQKSVLVAASGGLSGINAARIANAIRDCVQSTGESYDTARVRFKDHTGNVRSETFEVGNLEAAFVRRERLVFNTDLQSSYRVFSNDIISAMMAHI